MELTANITMKRKDKIFLSSFAFIENCSKLRFMQAELALHPLEYQLCNSFSNDQRKEKFIVGRYCAKMALASLLNIKNLNQIYIDFGVFNQPIIKAPNIPNIRVSISHDNHTSIAVAFPEEHPMGIDIESVCIDKISEIAEYLTPHEISLSRSLNYTNNIIITIIWTAKESLSKILQTGLTTSLSVLEIQSLIYNDKGYFRCTFTNFYQYQTISIIHKDKVITTTYPLHTEVELNTFFSLLG
jgi:4'-phosphopantetheinyl transferase